MDHFEFLTVSLSFKFNNWLQPRGVLSPYNAVSTQCIKC